jgi:hypothetical protein
MPIGGSATELNITGAKLKVSGGVQVSGSIAYTDDATGFGGVTAQIDNNNTLNITSGKLTGVTKIERSTAATITAITHTNVNNNTTIHIALKNTSSTRGVFITLGTFASDDTVKVNYTDDYLIGPGETGMLTLRKVNDVLSLFAREMFSDKASTFTDDNTNGNRPFYIKDGVNYKYPLYKYTAAGLTSEVIQGTTYYKPTAGITTKSRPPKGIPENVTPPSASGFAIGNNTDMTTLEYSVLGVSSSFDYASIIDNGGTTQTRFLLTDGEASGTFTESGASSGDSYKLFIEKTNTNLTDTVSTTSSTPSTPFAVFHHGTFANGGDPYSHGSVTAAATAGYFYSDTATGSYALGTLDETPTFVQETAAGGDGSGKTTYKFTTGDLTSVDHLLVAGGGGGGGDMGGGGGAGGYLETKNTTISEGQKTIVVGGGGIGGLHNSGDNYTNRGRNGADTSVTGLTTAIGGGGGGTRYDTSSYPAGNGGSGGGASGGRNQGGSYGGAPGTGTAGQGFGGGDSGDHWYPAGGGGASELGYGRNGTGGNNTTPHGGDGKQSTITGFTSYYFAGGGGGSGHTNRGGNGGNGGGGGGARHQTAYSHGVADTNGLTTGENGDDGTNQNSLEPPTNTAGGAGGKHTGGGGGGGDHHQHNWGGVGGSGIVIIRTGGNITTGKKIPKITGISNVTNIASKTINYTFNTQGTGIDKITYKIGSGSEVTTSSGVYTLAYTPADYGTTTITHAYAVDSSGNQLGTKFGPYSVTTKLSNLGHISPPILLFMSMGTTVTDSVNSVAFTTASGSFTYDTTNNAITNSSSARMKLDFTSVRTDRATAISAFYEFYLPSNTDYGYAASLGGVHDGTGNNNDAIGWYGHDSTTPITHYYGNGTLALPTQYNYSNYYGKWIKLGWVREASGNNFKVYVDGVYVHTHTPTDGSLTGTGVLSYFYLFRHACSGNENNYTTNDAISFRNLEIYQASFTDAQILAAYGS